MSEFSYGDSLRATARRHPDLFSAEELEALEEWISEIEQDPEKQKIFEWMQLAASACVLAAEE